MYFTNSSYNIITKKSIQLYQIILFGLTIQSKIYEKQYDSKPQFAKKLVCKYPRSYSRIYKRRICYLDKRNSKIIYDWLQTMRKPNIIQVKESVYVYNVQNQTRKNT